LPIAKVVQRTTNRLILLHRFGEIMSALHIAAEDIRPRRSDKNGVIISSITDFALYFRKRMSVAQPPMCKRLDKATVEENRCSKVIGAVKLLLNDQSSSFRCDGISSIGERFDKAGFSSTRAPGDEIFMGCQSNHFRQRCQAFPRQQHAPVGRPALAGVVAMGGVLIRHFQRHRHAAMR
jgi:hypothetical protein